MVYMSGCYGDVGRVVLRVEPAGVPLSPPLGGHRGQPGQSAQAAGAPHWSVLSVSPPGGGGQALKPHHLPGGGAGVQLDRGEQGRTVAASLQDRQAAHQDQVSNSTHSNWDFLLVLTKRLRQFL